LLIFQKLVQVFRLNWLVAVGVRADLVRGGKDVSHAKLTKRVATVWQNRWLSLIERVVILAPVATQQVLHIIQLI